MYAVKLADKSATSHPFLVTVEAIERDAR